MLRRRSRRGDTATSGFTVSEMLIALLIIALVTGGIASATSLYMRAAARMDRVARNLRLQPTAERLVQDFVAQSHAAGDRNESAWACSDHVVAGTCRDVSGIERACSLRLDPVDRGWRLSMNMSAAEGVAPIGPIGGAQAIFVCGARLTPDGWGRDQNPSTLVIMTSSSGQETPWISASTP